MFAPPTDSLGGVHILCAQYEFMCLFVSVFMCDSDINPKMAICLGTDVPTRVQKQKKKLLLVRAASNRGEF